MLGRYSESNSARITRKLDLIFQREISRPNLLCGKIRGSNSSWRVLTALGRKAPGTITPTVSLRRNQIDISGELLP